MNWSDRCDRVPPWLDMLAAPLWEVFFTWPRPANPPHRHLPESAHRASEVCALHAGRQLPAHRHGLLGLPSGPEADADADVRGWKIGVLGPRVIPRESSPRESPLIPKEFPAKEFPLIQGNLLRGISFKVLKSCQRDDFAPEG